MPARGDADDRVAGADLTLLQHAQVEARAAVTGQQRRHPRLGEPDADLVAGDPGLGDLEQRRADRIAVADADLLVGQAVDGEVLAELPELGQRMAELLLPVAVGADLVDEHGPVLPAVPDEVGLRVACDVEPADLAAVGHRRLPDGAAHPLAAPGDRAGLTDVNRQEPHGQCICSQTRSGATGW